MNRERVPLQAVPLHAVAPSRMTRQHATDRNKPFLTKIRADRTLTYDDIMALLYDHSDNDVIRIRWTSDEGSAIVTTGELRVALADGAIDPAEIESLEFLATRLS
jgi:hypothetical protein